MSDQSKERGGVGEAPERQASKATVRKKITPYASSCRSSVGPSDAAQEHGDAGS